MTRQEREQAVERESLIAVEQFIKHSQRRNWTPNDFSKDEIRKWGPKLSPNTVALTEGFMGVEAQLPSYLSEGENGLGSIQSEMMFQERWGFEEERHKPTLGLVLICSGARTEEQIEKYDAKVLQQSWSASEHPGLDNCLGARIYRMFQERGTYVNYRGLLGLVRQDYGLPQNLTSEERNRGQQIGAAELINKIAQDELAHHVINLQLVQIHLNYFPEETKEKVYQVLEGFKMPALNLLPNRREFVHALNRTRIYDATIHRQRVVEPTLKALNLAT